MNKDTIKGAAQKGFGEAESKLGDVTNSSNLKEKGALNQVKGAATETAGKFKDAVK